jgi:hypothetical protein
VRTILLALFLLACSGSNHAHAPAGAAEERTSFELAPPWVTPGERMVYQIRLRGMELAAMTFGVGDTTNLDGKRAIIVQGHATTVGLADRIASVNDTFTSWLDIQTGRSLWASSTIKTICSINTINTVQTICSIDTI